MTAHFSSSSIIAMDCAKPPYHIHDQRIRLCNSGQMIGEGRRGLIYTLI